MGSVLVGTGLAKRGLILRNPSLHLTDTHLLTARRVRMAGFTGFDYPARAPEAFEALGRWQRDGNLIHKEDVAYGLENAPKALPRLFAGENFGKQLVKLADVPA